LLLLLSLLLLDLLLLDLLLLLLLLLNLLLLNLLLLLRSLLLLLDTMGLGVIPSLVEEGHLAPVPHPRVVQVVHSRIDVA